MTQFHLTHWMKTQNEQIYNTIIRQGYITRDEAKAISSQYNRSIKDIRDNMIDKQKYEIIAMNGLFIMVQNKDFSVQNGEKSVKTGNFLNVFSENKIHYQKVTT